MGHVSHNYFRAGLSRDWKTTFCQAFHRGCCACPGQASPGEGLPRVLGTQGWRAVLTAPMQVWPGSPSVTALPRG